MKLVPLVGLPLAGAVLIATLANCGPTAPPPTEPSGSGSSAAMGSTSPKGTPDAGVARVMPKLDTACNADADCVVFDQELQDNPPQTYACCPGCTQHAGSKTWYQQFQAACASSPAPMCPPIGCAMPIVRAACNAHHCEAVPPAK